MKKIRGVVACAAALLMACACLIGCEGENGKENAMNTSEGVSEASVQTISAEEAHDLMAAGGALVVDVRTQEEFDSGHVCGAVLLPLDEITQDSASAVVPDKSQTVLVYCRSGRRSAQAAQILAGMGYEHVYDFGGIQSWPYEICSGEEGANAARE